jgi:hypothetical protein
MHWTDTEPFLLPAEELRVHSQELTASASFGRIWRGTWSAAARLVATGLHTQSERAVEDHQLVGPGLALAYSGFESTADSGARRGFALSADATWYPARLAEPAATITDLRGQLDVALPVPGLRRPTLHATATARDLVSSTQGLLVVGGSALLPLYALSDKPDPASSPAPDLPAPLLFAELLRGYEDYFIATDRVAIGEVSWRWPLIIDRGTAVTAVVLPASFVRQIDLELFASGAVDETAGARHQHGAAGGAITLRAIAIRILPLIVRYQVARRLRDDDAWTQRIELGFGF